MVTVEWDGVEADSGWEAFGRHWREGGKRGDKRDGRRRARFLRQRLHTYALLLLSVPLARNRNPDHIVRDI